MTTDTRLVAPDFELVHKVEGMDRKTAQRKVIGPYLAKCLHPVFSDEFESHELKELTTIETVGDVSQFSDNLQVLTNQRLNSLLEKKPDIRSKIGTLMASKKGMFTWDSPDTLLSEGVETGVAVPLIVGTQMVATEAFLSLNPVYSRILMRTPLNLPIDSEKLNLVLKGNAIDRLLALLCKGPNGFLEDRSIKPEYSSPEFFVFENLKQKRYMVFAEAFKIENGKVVGPSDDLVLSAHQRRIDLKRFDEKMISTGDELKRTSSGCPVRYTTTENGVTVKPLVLQAKDFVAEAVRLTSLKSA